MLRCGEHYHLLKQHVDSESNGFSHFGALLWYARGGFVGPCRSSWTCRDVR